MCKEIDAVYAIVTTIEERLCVNRERRKKKKDGNNRENKQTNKQTNTHTHTHKVGSQT